MKYFAFCLYQNGFRGRVRMCQEELAMMSKLRKEDPERWNDKDFDLLREADRILGIDPTKRCDDMDED